MIIEGLIISMIIFLVYASCNIRSNIYLKVFCKKQTEEKIVAVTFDDGPDPIQTPKVLQILKEQQIPACFFCIGHKVTGNESLIRQIIDDGHLIGNHSFTHTGHFPLYSLSRMKKDMQACQSALEQVTSQKIRLFRPPFGESYDSKSCPHIRIYPHRLEYQDIRYTASLQRESSATHPNQIASRFHYPPARPDAG